MKCIYCGANTHGPWKYCDQTCEQDHQTELENQNAEAQADAEDESQTTYDDLIDDDESAILDEMGRVQAEAEDAEYVYENRPAFTGTTDAF